MDDDVLFPIDGSENAEAALEHALSLAERYDGRIHALYVVSTTDSDVGATGRTTIEELRKRGESVVRAAEERATAEGIDVLTRIEEGDPYEGSSTTARRTPT